MPPIVSDKYKSERKALILESAFACFAEKGFQTATMDDIVAHSGLSKGAIYNYFKSKDEIYIELMNRNTERNIQDIKSKIATFQSAAEKLDYIFNLYSGLDKHPQFLNSIRVHIEFWLYSSRKPELRELLISRYEIYKNLFKDVLKDGIDNGELSKELNIDEIALVFWGIIDGLSLHYAVLTDKLQYTNIIQEAKEMFFTKLKINQKSE